MTTRAALSPPTDAEIAEWRASHELIRAYGMAKAAHRDAYEDMGLLYAACGPNTSKDAAESVVAASQSALAAVRAALDAIEKRGAAMVPPPPPPYEPPPEKPEGWKEPWEREPPYEEPPFRYSCNDTSVRMYGDRHG